MVDWVQREVEGWGRWPVVNAEVARPESRHEMVRALEEAKQAGKGLLAYGLGRSYGDTALLKDGRVLLTRRLDRMLGFDPDTGWLEAESGVSIEDLLRVFVPRGFFPPVTPGTKFVTLGGAFACDVHGKNHHVDGSFSDHVESVELLLASGEVKRVSREHEPELFAATAGGLGLTGLILSLRLRMKPIASPYIAMETIRVENLDHFLEVSRESLGYTHTMGWIDCVTRGAAMGRGIFMRGAHTDQVPKASLLSKLKQGIEPLLDVPLDFPSWALNGASVRGFNEVYFRKQPAGLTPSLTHYEPFFYPLDSVRRWNRIYGKRGFLQYQVVLPKESDNKSLRLILDTITRSGMGSFLAVLKEFGERENGWLSFPKPGITLALDFPAYGAELLTLLDRLDAITLEAGGRGYLAKDARLSPETFRQMYPEWERFQALKDKVDPHHLFRSEMSERLGLTQANAKGATR